jgi:hypothetical protein
MTPAYSLSLSLRRLDEIERNASSKTAMRTH